MKKCGRPRSIISTLKNMSLNPLKDKENNSNKEFFGSDINDTRPFLAFGRVRK